MANLAREAAIVKVIEGVGGAFHYFVAAFVFYPHLIALFDA